MQSIRVCLRAMISHVMRQTLHITEAFLDDIDTLLARVGPKDYKCN